MMFNKHDEAECMRRSCMSGDTRIVKYDRTDIA